MKVPAVAPLPTRKVQTLLDFHDGLAASTEYRSQIETASFARPLPRKSCGCNIYTAFCAQMLRASQVLSIQSSGSTSDQTSPIFFASWQLSFGRYDAPKFERFRWHEILSLVYRSLTLAWMLPSKIFLGSWAKQYCRRCPLFTWNREASNTFFNETSQFSERNNAIAPTCMSRGKKIVILG